MSKMFYAKLALSNIKKNGKFYFPYILTCIGTIMMFYIMCFIVTNDGISKMSGSIYIKTIMIFGTIIIGIFATIFLFYTNSFLIKRRKKEFGLFNILGMDKRNLGRVLGIENLIVASAGLIAGLLCGILFSRLMIMILAKLLKFNISFGFQISVLAVAITVIVFTSIFILIYLNTLRQLHFSKPIELLYGSNVGEREPKTKWVLASFGAISLLSGYYIAITTNSPLAAIGLFFIAVLLVIIGTYLLFIAGSIALLKILRKNKSYYYQTNHFTTISGMLYRMKQNAVGLANICILSTMVLVMISTTVCLYLGFDDALRNLYPRNIEVTAQSISVKDSGYLNEIIDKTISESNNGSINTFQLRYLNFMVSQKENNFSFVSNGVYLKTDAIAVLFIPLDEYNRINNTTLSLKEDELMAYCKKTAIGDNVTFAGNNYKIIKLTEDAGLAKYTSIKFSDNYFIFIAPSEKVIMNIYNSIALDKASNTNLNYYLGFDTNTDGVAQLALYNKINTSLDNSKSINSDRIYVGCAESIREEFLTIYGGLFFLGIFLGLLFMMATVLIIYYKQVSEGYDDKHRFEIMQKVGLSRTEVKSTVKTQVLTVFFLPLIAAVVHIAAAFKMITKLLAALNLTNIVLFAWCVVGTVVVFSLIYALVYTLTARAYYKIVE
ncbi:MAG: ABC transporter permease [Eubacteriaceae bacterium]|nr:ABC transporter permease [Eubacteriaceae bacterium]